MKTTQKLVMLLLVGLLIMPVACWSQNKKNKKEKIDWAQKIFNGTACKEVTKKKLFFIYKESAWEHRTFVDSSKNAGYKLSKHIKIDIKHPYQLKLKWAVAKRDSIREVLNCADVPVQIDTVDISQVLL
jgi:hypothetical protein